ncbi:hypothetical protein Tco_1309756 [Tanacetum coccineum]
MQLQQEVFQNDESCVNQNVVEIQEYFEINDLKARLQDKDKTIYKLKATIKSLRENTKEENVNHDKELENSVAKLLYENKRKEIVKHVVHTPSATTIALGMFKLDLVLLPPRLLQKRDGHIDYIRHTQEQANTLREIVKQAKAKQPLDSKLDFALVNCSTSNCGSNPPGNKKNDRISQTPSRNKKNKVEAQPRKVNKTNCIVKPICNVDLKHSLSNANSEILCTTCNKSMFDGVHDKCLLDLMQRKEIVKHVVHTPSATTIAPGMFKLDLVPFLTRLLQNRDAHIDYLRHTQEQANTLREIVEQAKAKQPLDSELDFACKYATRIQELLVYVQYACPNAITPSTKKVDVSPMNNVKKVKFGEHFTSSSNIKQVESSNTSDSNTHVLSFTGVKCSTSNCGSKPPSNKRNDRMWYWEFPSPSPSLSYPVMKQLANKEKIDLKNQSKCFL